MSRHAIRLAGFFCAASLLMLAPACGGNRNRPQPEVTDPAKAPLLSGKNTLVYHTRECRYCRDIPDAELLGYANPDAAERTRRIPCASCNPREQFALSPYVLDADKQP